MVELCWSRGPRIGEQGVPYCKRPWLHPLPHRPAVEDGWGNMEWGDPEDRKRPADLPTNREELLDLALRGTCPNCRGQSEERCRCEWDPDVGVEVKVPKVLLLQFLKQTQDVR